ncbi:flavin reductase (NADPH) [Athalia rosae]|uniref:flavin reductase (NADPH) n=1 Tax=Athalia rosae TaxID=37344 RepID=UPI0020339F77|nr:flavin reductase (NADPH) [Athalia rosae]
MNKIVIFGCTGTTGLCALSHAVEKGLKVTAFVRDISKVPSKIKDAVQIVVGDVTNQEDVSKAVSGQDGVVVILGTRNNLEATTVLSEGMKNIVAAMKEHKVEVTSVCLSAFLFYPPEKVPAIFKHLNADHERQFEITKQSGLKWIAVLPPHIADSPSSKYVTKYDESAGRAISKYDLGAFLVESLSQPEHYQKVIGIANSS